MSDRSLSSRVARGLISARFVLLALAVLLASLAWAPSRQLTFDRAIENMFAPDDPLLDPYHRLKRTFGGHEIVMAAYLDPGLMTPEGMQRLADLTNQLSQVPGVESALSLYGLMGDAILDDSNPMAVRTRQMFEGYTHRIDPETGIVASSVVCMLEPESETSTPRELTIRKMREVMRDIPTGTVTGEPVMVVDGFRYIEQDGERLGITSTVLLMLVILICFRSLRWVVIPLAVVQLTLLLTRALLVEVGFRLSMVSSMLTAIVTVVGVATVIHLIVRFRDARAQGDTQREAMVQAMTLLAIPMFWACSTDAVGFAALLWASVGPVQDFGVMMATGSLLVLVSVVLVVPGLALLGRLDSDPKRAWGESQLDGLLRGCLLGVERHPRITATATLVVLGVSLAGIARLEVETDFTKNFRRDSPVVQSFEFVETHLGGVGVWDIILPAPESKNMSTEYLARVRKLETRLREEASGLTKVLSLADAVENLSPVSLNSLPKVVRDSVMRNAVLTGMRLKMPIFMKALQGVDPQTDKPYLRIMLRSYERQPAEQKQALIEQVTRIANEEFAKIREDMPEDFQSSDVPEVTGYFVLFTRLIDSMIRDQWKTFGIALLGIGVMMLVAFGNPLQALVALVPNALPILLVSGLLGWLDLKINMGAAMIAAVSLGLSVDSSIHYISAFRRALREGLSRDDALSAVQQTVGRALVFSTLALIVGFGALLESRFVPTIYFGALVSLSMLGGLAGNLLVLPMLLRAVTPAGAKEKSKT